MMRRRRHAATAMAMLALIGALGLGCLGRSPNARHYTMSATEGTVVDTGSTGLGIELGPLNIPSYLDRPQIAIRVSPSEIEFDDQNRWAGGFRSNVERVLADNLGSRLNASRTRARGGVPSIPISRIVRIDILSFEGMPGERLTLRAQWAIAKRGDRSETRSGTTSLRVPLDDDRIDTLVRAHDEALGQLADAIAAEIADGWSGTS